MTLMAWVTAMSATISLWRLNGKQSFRPTLVAGWAGVSLAGLSEGERGLWQRGGFFVIASSQDGLSPHPLQGGVSRRPLRVPLVRDSREPCLLGIQHLFRRCLACV